MLVSTVEDQSLGSSAFSVLQLCAPCASCISRTLPNAISMIVDPWLPLSPCFVSFAAIRCTRWQPRMMLQCHCLDCQRTTGSAFVVHLIIPESDLEICGETRMGLGPTGSGAGCELHTCSACNVIVWVRYRYHRVPVIAVRAGTLDHPGSVAPGAHIFVRSKQPWLSLPADCPAYEAGADRTTIWPAASLERYAALPPITRQASSSNTKPLVAMQTPPGSCS